MTVQQAREVVARIRQLHQFAFECAIGENYSEAIVTFGRAINLLSEFSAALNRPLDELRTWIEWRPGLENSAAQNTSRSSQQDTNTSSNPFPSNTAYRPEDSFVARSSKT